MRTFIAFTFRCCIDNRYPKDGTDDRIATMVEIALRFPALYDHQDPAIIDR